MAGIARAETSCFACSVRLEIADADPATVAWAQIGATLLALEHREGAAELAGTRAALATFAELKDVGGQLAAHTQLVALYHSGGAYDLAREHGEAAYALATLANRRRDVLVALHESHLARHPYRQPRRGTLSARFVADARQ